MEKTGRHGQARKRRFEKYVQLAFESGATEAKVIPARHVVTAEWVRLKCQFGCRGYNKRLCCPPYTPTPDVTRRMLVEYDHVLIFTHQGRYERRERKRMQRELAALERTAFLDGLYKAFAMGAGPCRLCPVCDTSRRCKYPDIARPSMESCGIDVYATCRNAGIELRVVTSLEQTAKYVSLLLLD